MSNPSLRPRVSPRKTGEPFNPHRESFRFYAPDAVSRQRNLTDGQKRLYERLVRWAGRKGECWWSFEKMARELGKSVRQVKSDMSALERYGLVTHVRCGKRLANLYRFLWHPIFEGGDVQSTAPHEPAPDPGGDVQPAALHGEGKEVQDSPDEGQPAARGDGQPAAHELCPENSVPRIASSSEPRNEPETALKSRAADDDSSSKTTLKSTVRECLTAFVQASGISMPSGRMPDAAIAADLGRIGAAIPDLVEFLKDYARRWTGAPATWKHVLVSVRNWANDPKTKAAIGNRIARQYAHAREQQAQAELERELTTAVGYRDALAQLRGVKIPWPLKAQLERTGDLISPTDLERQAREWRPCPECRDRGSLGRAIDKDLRFCTCAAGVETRYDDGENWPEKEIARVHGDARSLLAAACYEMGMSFMGDAVDQAEVKDDGSTLAISPAALHVRTQAIHEGDIARVLERIAWKRDVQIGPYTSSQVRMTGDEVPAETDPNLAPSEAPPQIVDSANCPRCGSLLILLSDGTSHDCKCRQN